jgi:hypothetical protein
VIATKRNHGQDQFGRSGSVFPIRLLALAIFSMIFGSAWPSSARSLAPACDSSYRMPVLTISVQALTRRWFLGVRATR